MIRSLVALFALSVITAAAQETPKPDQAANALRDQTDKVFAKWDSTVSPGCALAVIQNGSIVYERGYGMADLDHDVSITPQTVFHVASISKQFTAAAIILLAQDGKLSLDDDVHKYIPELPAFGGARITLRHLVFHTSGLRDQWSLLGLAGWRYSLDLITDDDVMRLMELQKDLNFKPGDQHVYCNTGYTLLAQIVKRVSGQSLREFTTRRIFEPLGMASTRFRDDHAEIVKHIAYGYTRENGRNVYRLSVTNFDTVGATSLLTTVEDLARWDENFYHPRVGGQAMIEQQLERGKLNSGKLLDYAFGLVDGKYRGLRTIDHAGADAGYRADLVRFPDQHFSVACLCNEAQTNPSELARKVTDIWLAGQLKEPPPARVEPSTKPVTIAQERLAEYAGLYWKKDDESAMRIGQKDGKLFLSESEEDRLDLSPVAENRFLLVVFPVWFTFDQPAPGAPRRLSVQGPNDDAPNLFERVTEFQPAPEQLNAYVGSYVSDEIEPVYSIAVEDGRLVLKRLKSKPDKLRPLIADYFEGSTGELHFKRDQAGEVTGFLLNTGRIKNFKFRRSASVLAAR
ncbi:MAG TPA: serine hydrolase domain-containing protein [Bryobacteraceae bacterium]|nr:serine hydrolase domain-containing protein [Bryobacteraceae bacterium]